VLLEEFADAALAGLRRERLKKLAAVSLLILDDLGMRKLPVTATEYRLELIMGRYERVSTLLTSNRPVAPWASGARAAPSACEEPNFPRSMSVSKSSAPRARRPRHARGVSIPAGSGRTPCGRPWTITSRVGGTPGASCGRA
jgi:IstB-like ATP binding protein